MSHPDAKSMCGSKVGPCWHAYCGSTVVWPPAGVTAYVECDSEFNPHRALCYPADTSTP